ncbi:NYN domain-containing protein [uncultured Cellulomonas sp.]|uniref:NYN domain-containing protein n=1 Tax=uncultured Cellulomonas sp. TaxID=189682 RepID=UPI00260DA332|nr:NYN domain-containing protein [uncultured Cellulomonas sp.]
MAGVTAEAVSPRTTYVLVDGENIDATLGSAILQGRPTPEQRPRWERILDFAQRTWSQPVKGLFFLNASSGTMPMSFVQALTAIGFQPIPLSGESYEKVVDIGIQRTLAALADRTGDVLLASHDGDFAADVARLLDDADRRVGLLAFREFTSSGLTQLTDRGLTLFDLEGDVKAFNVQLPRLRIIPLAEFDPLRYL